MGTFERAMMASIPERVKPEHIVEVAREEPKDLPHKRGFELCSK